MSLKKIYIKVLLCSVILILAAAGLTACGNSPESPAEKAAGDFLTQLNTFQDVDKIIDNGSFLNMQDTFVKKFESYMTNEAFNSMYGQRIGYIAVLVGFYNKSNTDVQNVKLELKDGDDKAETFYYGYTVDVKLTPISGGQTSTVKVIGEITVKKDNEKWKVSYFNILSKDWMALGMRKIN